MVMGLERGSKDEAMLKEFVIMCKELWEVSNRYDEAYWNKAISTIDKYCAKYKNDGFATDLAAALMTRLDNEARRIYG